jgi:predicted nucleic acid-binding protein
MIKAVIDTNVIVSAYITKNLEAATSKVWEAVLQCKLTPIYNDEILDEYSNTSRDARNSATRRNPVIEE